MLNSVQLIGYLGKDAEIRNTSAGSQVASFSVATSESWRDRQSGEWKEKTEWHRIAVFGADAFMAMVDERGKKGAFVYVSGKLQSRRWTGNDGIEKMTTEVIVDQRGTLKFLDKREGRTTAAQRQPAANSQKGGPGASTREYEPAPVYDDDIPF